jgi:hypothetical protein
LGVLNEVLSAKYVNLDRGFFQFKINTSMKEIKSNGMFHPDGLAL